MHTQIPLTRDLVFIGGGHAHALALRMWGMAPVPGVRLTLINPGPTAPYSGMLPGHVAGHYDRGALDIDLVKLARFAGARLILGRAVGIDPQKREVTVEGRGAIAYDVVSIDVGIHAEMPGIAGFADHGIGAKPLDLYATRWAAFTQKVRAGQAAARIAVIGGGIAGVELSMAMAHKLRSDGAEPAVTLIDRGAVLGDMGQRARARMLAALEGQGVALEPRAEVSRVEDSRVVLADGRTIASEFTVGAAGAFAHGWIADSGLPLTDDGFVRVGPTLEVEGLKGHFAVGDCAHMTHAPRPKAGVYAVRAAPVLLTNLKAAVTGAKMRRFHPQRDFLKLVSLGGRHAAALRGSVAVGGAWVWRWKNRIDQRFMDKFRQLPDMRQDHPPGPVALGVHEELGDTAMLCAGCGAKVGPGVLAARLAKLDPVGREDVLSGPGDDAAVLSVGGQEQVLTTDHLRAFTEDLGLFARIATVHALGDIWAMGARPQAALLSVTLVRQSAPLLGRAMDEVMAGVETVLRAEGAEIVGGHSSMGAETTLGLSLTGLLDRPALRASGAQVGDVLVLTRPIGSGTVLAAEMQGRAAGADVAQMLATMARPQGDVARALHAAHAMTDVTGFGLAGHLSTLCTGSGVGAEIDLDAVPLYPGALALAEAGIRSTIHAANALAAPVAGEGEAARRALLHDPQTAGGFLAAVPAENVDDALDGIAQAGGTGHVIGRVIDAPGLRLV